MTGEPHNSAGAGQAASIAMETFEIDGRFLIELGFLHTRLQNVALARASQETASGAGQARVTAEADLDAAICSLVAVLRFLNGAGFEQEQREPLEKLASALDDLFNGGRPALLLTKAPRNRPPTVPSDRHLQTLAALAMDYLLKAGMRSDDAEKHVAAEFTKRGHKQTATKPISARVVKEWRLKSTGPGGEPDRRAEFDYLRKSAELWRADKPLDIPWAMKLTQVLASAVQPKDR